MVRIDEKLLETKIKTDTAFVSKLTSDPKQALKEVKAGPINDKGVFKLLLFLLAFIIIFCLFAVLNISLSDGLIITEQVGDEIKEIVVKREVDQIYLMIGSAAIGALTGLLVPTGNSN